LQWKR
jgi:hypothetical protein